MLNLQTLTEEQKALVTFVEFKKAVSIQDFEDEDMNTLRSLLEQGILVCDWGSVEREDGISVARLFVSLAKSNTE